MKTTFREKLQKDSDPEEYAKHSLFDRQGTEISKAKDM